jgi:hypothetical protein
MKLIIAKKKTETKIKLKKREKRKANTLKKQLSSIPTRGMGTVTTDLQSRELEQLLAMKKLPTTPILYTRIVLQGAELSSTRVF